ncbi:SDR family NAD(P)-dependent oxidoreductase [Teichococcus vastitatis]|jgi:short-subunit dehydrogenase|uniref:SDR family NAD(P)-dependent oxidoreductase n=1 Tax=Teichococcus vastitatis TaxID=2307076 RepID=A0ABS9W9T0_9PROT|nr:SDR family NAD(P)-dependent oxidoreductase [Pseudoroseomonas vastitatis]MCI0756066.1 SDR family NAD(P)-dependent oxidoreductase [Pseudoroseomonas vastitatis]
MTAELWVVLGASSSVARAFARAAAEGGADIVLAGRDQADLADTAADLRLRTGRHVECLDFDAAGFEDHDAFVERCWRIAQGRRLNLFFAAGSMPDQDAAMRDFRLARSILEVNFLSVVSLLNRLEPGLRAQRGGAVVVLGSVAGDRGRRKNFLYGSAKAGLHTYLQGMRGRMLADGVRVVTVKPGFLDTAMTWGLPGLFLVASPQAAARASLQAAGRGRDEIYYPGFWRLIMLIIKLIPEAVFKRLSI